jgi:3-deoxy-D-manno-octulosonic-acid transferase
MLLSISKLFNKKIRDREKNWEKVLLNEKSKLLSLKGFRIWFHSASMGEFEQAKPIIEKIKKMHPDIVIIISFFSPSGYNNQKNYEFADSVLYLPFDTLANAKYFIKNIKPDMAVFIRYEIWRNFLRILKKKHIPAFLICATKPNQKFLYKLPFLRQFTKSNYSIFKKIFTVSEEHTQFFQDLKILSEIQTLSDTRFDRIIENVEKAKNKSIYPKELFKEHEFILVAGSTWEKDEDILIDSLIDIEKQNANIKFIIVPHEPTEKHIKKLKSQLPHSYLLSQIEDFLKKENQLTNISNFLGKNHIIVDSIGKLLTLYSLADAAYIGGGFGSGVHSITEPAGYGIPLACGPKYFNSPDAIKLYSYGSLKVMKNKNDFSEWLMKNIKDETYRVQAGMLNRDYLYKLKGSTDKIIMDLEKEIKIT